MPFTVHQSPSCGLQIVYFVWPTVQNPKYSVFNYMFFKKQQMLTFFGVHALKIPLTINPISKWLLLDFLCQSSNHFSTAPLCLSLQMHTLLTCHRSSSHTLKSTLNVGFNIRVTWPVSHIIRWISEDLTANRHTAPDLSHLDMAASQWGVFVLSRHGTMGQPGPGLSPSGPGALSEPPACGGWPYL